MTIAWTKIVGVLPTDKKHTNFNESLGDKCGQKFMIINVLITLNSTYASLYLKKKDN